MLDGIDYQSLQKVFALMAALIKRSTEFEKTAPITRIIRAAVGLFLGRQ